jgi:crotonobetaine/carnitine-CoA ligase
MANAAVALSKRFSARSFWREINVTQATHCSLLSAMINILWLQPPSPLEQTHALRVCLLVPTPEFSDEFEKRYNVKIASIYSLSDFGLATVLPADAPREKMRSAGRAIPEISVAILDEDDVPVSTGKVGEICLRNTEPWFGRQGYYKMSEVFLAATRNLWFHTGDRGWLDDDGYLYFAGRSKDLIRRRGENISALTVEQIIMKHPAVADVAVYAVRAEFLEDEVMASVVCKSGLELDHAELIRFCAPHMAYFMVPRFMEFVAELPVTPTNKVEKYKLREDVEKRLSMVWDREKSGIVLEK